MLARSSFNCNKPTSSFHEDPMSQYCSDWQISNFFDFPTQQQMNNLKQKIPDNEIQQSFSRVFGNVQCDMECHNLSPSSEEIDYKALQLSIQSTGTQEFCDITKYLAMPQIEAAAKLGIPTSTLSKRWKEAVPSRKWPWRMINKIDKEIISILKDVPPNGAVPINQRNSLALLIRKRKEELQPVAIRI